MGTIVKNVINLDIFSISIGPSNPFQHLAFVNLSDFDFTTHVRTSRHPTHGTTITPQSIGIKRKISLIFMSVIEANDKKNKALVGTIDHINASQFEIEKTKPSPMKIHSQNNSHTLYKGIRRLTR